MEVVVSMWFFLSKRAQNSYSRIITLSWKEKQPQLSGYAGTDTLGSILGD